MGLRILAIDDDPMLCELLHSLLEAAHYQVMVARSGEEGLAGILADPAPDAVILDLNMPDMDGFQVLETLKDRGVTNLPPIIVLTARYSQEDARRVLDLGASEFMTKPFGNMALLSKLHTSMHRQAAT